MTLEEAIKHCHEKAEELRTPIAYTDIEGNLRATETCEECAKEHEQLATWLEELLEWHKRVEISKNGRCSIIVQGVPLFLTQGHIDALIDYENEMILRRTTTDILEDVMNFNKEIAEEYKYNGKAFDNKEKE